MKRILILSLALLLLLACVPTPTEEYVLQKTEETVAAVAPLNKEDAEKAVSASFTENGTEITFDAEPELPACDHVWSERADAVTFEAYDLARMVKALFGDAELYECGELTKQEIEPALLRALEQLEEVKAHPEQYEAGAAVYQAEVNELQTQYNNALDQDVLKPVEIGWMHNEYASYFCCRADLGRESYASVTINNQYPPESGIDDYNSYLIFQYRDLYESMTKLRRDDPNVKQPQPSVSKEQAIETAAALVSQMGANHMEFAACEEGLRIDSMTKQIASDAYEHAAWLVYFTYSADGMQTTYDPAWMTSFEADETEIFSAPMYYERITVGVDEDGIVFVDWRGPTAVGETVNENVLMLSTDEIVKRAAKYFSYLYPVSKALQNASNDGNAVSADTLSRGSVVSCTIQITRITLGWTQIVSKGTNRTSTRIPVWDFFGSVKRTYENGETEVTDGGLFSLLTLDASTGARIDRNLGY